MRPEATAGLSTIEQTLLSMGRACRGALRSSADTLISDESLLRRTIVLGDDQIDEAERRSQLEASRLLTAGVLQAHELQQLMVFLHVAVLLERVGDAAVNVATLGSDAARLPSPPDRSVITRLHEMGTTAAAMVGTAMDALVTRDPGALDRLSPDERMVDDHDRSTFRAVVELGADRRYREWGLRIEQISRQFKRAADHAVSIAREGAQLGLGLSPLSH